MSVIDDAEAARNKRRAKAGWTDDPSSLSADSTIRVRGRRFTLQDILDSISYGQTNTSGIGKQSSFNLEKILGRKYGIQFGDSGLATNLGFDQGGAASPADAPEFEGMIRAIRAGSPEAHSSALREKFMQEYKQRTIDQGKAEFESTTKPVLDQVRAQISELLAKPVMSAEDTARIRSQIGAVAKANAEASLRRVGATLGIRGMGPDDPAGAALASRAAEAADRALIDNLRQFGIDVAQIEAEAKSRNLALSSGLAINQGTFERGLQTGDLGIMSDASRGISSLIEAIIASKTQSAADRKALRASVTGSALQGAGSLLGGGLEGLGTVLAAP